MNNVKMFEEFLNDPVQNELIKKQLTTNNVTGNIPVTHEVSQIVSDENGMHVDVNPQHAGEAPVLSPANESEDTLNEETETKLEGVSFFKTKDGEGVVIKELGNRKESVFVSWEDLSKINK